MLLQEQALNLLETNAPISPHETSTRYQFVTMRSEGLDNEDIAQSLNVDLDLIIEIEIGIVEEFMK